MENAFTDPKKVGTGIWWYIHNTAREAIDDPSISKFIDLMMNLKVKFPCHTCRKHINEYIDTHPFEELRNLVDSDGVRIGMFKWSWLFHNAVNTRIGKPYVDWETAVGMFYNDGIEVCSKNCEEADSHYQQPTEENHEQQEKEDRKSKLAQAYFMSVGIPRVLRQQGIVMKQPEIVN